MGALKRSFINEKFRQAIEAVKRSGYPVPEYMMWSPEDWATKSREYQEIVDCQMGWDITDFGSGDFGKDGLVTFNPLNGKYGDARYVRPYGERLCFSWPGSNGGPLHYHRGKMEDLQNWSEGSMYVRHWNVTPYGERDFDSMVMVRIDGRRYMVKPGEIIEVKHHQRICSMPFIAHEGVAVDDVPYDPDALPGFCVELSSVVNDRVDNIYFEPWRKWDVDVIEDEPAQFCRVNEYPALKD